MITRRKILNYIGTLPFVSLFSSNSILNTDINYKRRHSTLTIVDVNISDVYYPPIEIFKNDWIRTVTISGRKHIPTKIIKSRNPWCRITHNNIKYAIPLIYDEFPSNKDIKQMEDISKGGVIIYRYKPKNLHGLMGYN